MQSPTIPLATPSLMDQSVTSHDDASLSSAGSSSGSGSLSRGLRGTLSTQSLNKPRLLTGLSATWSGKPPKTPRPDRSLTIFKSIEKGLKECICTTQSDILQLKASIDDGLSVSSAQQNKAAERYLKRLEFQLAKLEELKDQYELQQKMKDGVKCMAYAYILSPGKEKDSALNSVRVSYRQCIESLCAIEADLESMMGTLFFEMKGIQGFARLCPGDVFEITLKHGDNQKWKTKGRIMKNGNQVWDAKHALFKSLLGDVLSIKAVEVRGLGKNIAIGHKLCETKDLFSASPQLMTCNLNSIGTLKLNLVVTWNPLHGLGAGSSDTIPNKTHSSASSLMGIGSSKTLPTILMSNSPNSRRHRMAATLQTNPRVTQILDSSYYHQYSAGATPTSTSTSSGSTGSSLHLSGKNVGSFYGFSASQPNSTLTSPETESAPILSPSSDTSSCKQVSSQNANHRSQEVIVEIHQQDSDQSLSAASSRSSSSSSHHVSNHHYQSHHHHYRYNDGEDSRNAFDEHEEEKEEDDANGDRQGQQMQYKQSSHTWTDDNRPSESDIRQHAPVLINLSEVLVNLLSSLEDIQGQYCELHKLHINVQEVFKLVKVISRFNALLYGRSGGSLKHQSLQRRRNDGNRHARRGSTCSDISESIETALECFDFLNSQLSDSEADSPEHERYTSPDMSNVDSGVEFLAKKQSGNCTADNAVNASPSTSGTPSPTSVSSPQPLSTGYDQLDLAIVSHLTYCQRLIENLGAFGPLRKRESMSLEKLESQSLAVGLLCRLCDNLRDYLQQLATRSEAYTQLKYDYLHKQAAVLNFLTNESRIAQIWDLCVDRGTATSTVVSVTSEKFARALDVYIRNTLGTTNYPTLKLAKFVTTRVIDAPNYEPDCIVTILQIGIYLSRQNASLQHLIKIHLDEIQTMDSIQSNDAIEIKQALNRFKKCLPPKEPLFQISLLLLDSDPLVVRIAEQFYLEANKNKSMRTALLAQFSEGLESDLSAIRQSSCLVVMLINAVELKDHLVYISYADTSELVREQAKSALFSFGDEGRCIYQEKQLFFNGFNGLAVK